MTVYTIGHSTRSLDDFVGLLQAHGVVQLADVRTKSLPVAGIRYRHFPGLGGMRKPLSDSDNRGWRHPSFRGYADYMQTAAFAGELDELVAWSDDGATAVMCAEAVWWQCHRQLIADALVARGVETRHIMSARQADAHTITSFARIDGARVTYPGLI